MNRRDVLLRALSKTFNQNTINSFLEYQLSSSDLNFVKYAVTQALQTIKPRPLDCVLLSAVIAVNIQDHSNIPVALIGGDLKYKNLPIFTHHGTQDLNIEAINSNVLNSKLEGHFWIEIGDMIIDSSIFRTLYSNHFPEYLRNEIKSKIDDEKDYIIATPKEMIQQYNFEYVPRYSLSDETISGLIAGAFFENRIK